MKHILLLALVTFTQPAFSIPIPDPIPGLQAALQFCTTIEDENEIPQCVRLESGANWVTKEALSICRSQNFDSDRVNCLRAL